MLEPAPPAAPEPPGTSPEPAPEAAPNLHQDRWGVPNHSPVLIPGRTAQKGPVLEKNALNRLVHNLLELISKGYNPTDLSQQPSCNFPGKQIKILFHNLYVD